MFSVAFLITVFVAALSLTAQQPQCLTCSDYGTSSRYVQGIGPGYKLTAGSGLTLNVAAGRVRCASTMTNYAGGTLAMANNTTNYVFLDTGSSCAPSSNTTGYTSSLIVLGTVGTSGGVITTITMDVTFGISSVLGGALIHGIPFTIGDPAGSALTVASTTTDYVTVPFACTIKAYNLVILPSGTITVKFWKVATGTAAPTSSNSISTSGVGISTGNAIHSATVSDFTTTAVAANDIMAMNVTAVATASYVNGVLQCEQ
jgi:hypothetical protein